MQEQFNKFFNQYNNQPVEKEDPSAPDQCMDLIFAWCDFLGIPREAVRHQYAYQVWANPNDATRKYFDLIVNTPTSVSKVGDIIVFGKNGDRAVSGFISGLPVGHVSIDNGQSNMNDAMSFDQNWDTLHYFKTDKYGNRIPYSRTVKHTGYYGIVGYLRPKVQASGDDVLLNQVKAIVDGSGDPKTKIAQIRALLKV